MKNRRLSTCGFLFALFAVVEGDGLNVVDRRVSWQTGHADAPRGQNDPFSSVTEGPFGFRAPA